MRTEICGCSQLSITARLLSAFKQFVVRVHLLHFITFCWIVQEIERYSGILSPPLYTSLSAFGGATVCDVIIHRTSQLFKHTHKRIYGTCGEVIDLNRDN